MPNHLPEVNLLPKHERSSSSYFQMFIGLIIILILAYGLLGFYYFTSKSQLKEEQATYTQVISDNEVLQAQIDQSTSSDDVNLADVLSFIEGHDMRTSYLLEEVDELLPEDSYLSEYVYDNYEGALTVHFETLDDVAQYTKKLTESSFSTDVLVDEVGTFKPRDNEETNEEILLHNPRYETTFTIDIEKDTLRGGLVHDE